MWTLIAVVGAGLSVAAMLLVFTAIADQTPPASDPSDAANPVDAEHWLVVRARRFPRIGRLLALLDRRLLGGVAVAVCFTAIFLAALFVGWIFSSIDSDRGFARWDQSVADWGPDHASSQTVSAMKVITLLGSSYVVFIIMVVIGAIDWFRRRNATSLWFLLTVGVGVSVVYNGLKWSIMRDRPPVEHLVGASGSSFPSGHSAMAAACWMAIALVTGRWLPQRIRPWLAIVAVGIAGLVAASRALLGVHWLTDVIAGVMVGWTWFLVIAVIFGGRLQRFGRPIERVAPSASTLARPDERSPPWDLTRPRVPRSV